MWRASSKAATFFCESCGSEVPRKSKFCPACGKFFASVRCPECGKTGMSEDFKNGCPRCGYAVNGSASLKKHRKNRDMAILTGGVSGTGAFAARKKADGVDSAPPFWAYCVSVLVLAVLVGALYSCL